MEYTFWMYISFMRHLLMLFLGHICNYMLGEITFMQLIENLVAIIIYNYFLVQN
jgi:hypothetical protein